MYGEPTAAALLEHNRLALAQRVDKTVNLDHRLDVVGEYPEALANLHMLVRRDAAQHTEMVLGLPLCPERLVSRPRLKPLGRRVEDECGVEREAVEVAERVVRPERRDDF